MPMQDHLRQEWNKAGYGTQMGSSCVVPPPAPDLLRVYHITNTEYGISNIALGRLKVARFAELNDPFELLAVDCKDAVTRRAAQRYKEQFNETHGLLCFSENWTNPLLWSHYGERHSGICLGFDLDRPLAQPIHYETARQKFTLGQTAPDGLPDRVKEFLVMTKFDHWKYEQEQQVLVELRNCEIEGRLHFRPFDQTLRLVEVVLGPLCDLSLQAVRALVARD